MTSMNPSWDPRAALRDALGDADFRSEMRGAFFGPRGPRGGRRGRPPFAPDRPDITVNVDVDGADGPDRGGRRHSGRGFPGGPFGPAGPGFPGGPFGPGGPRGRGFGGPRGGRRGRRTNRGDVRLAVLALVAERPRHGYEIIQEIAERSGGRWRPSPGSVYPTLSQLEDEALVRVEQTDGRRVVHLTETGTTFVAEHREELDKVWASYDGDGEDGPETVLWEQLGQLHAAAQQVIAAGNTEQIGAATEALTEARKTIYRLLAE